MYRSGENLYQEIIHFQKQAKSLIIFTPYIQSYTLEKIIQDISRKINSIVTTWRPRDFLLGVNDLEVFSLCSNYQIPLLINNRLHAKVYLDYPKYSLISTANISNQAMGIKSKKYNYEVATKVENTLEDITYFDKILIESMEVNKEMYVNMKEYINSTDLEELSDEYIFETVEDHFLISALPMSESVDKIYQVYSGDMELAFEEKQAALHDIYKYSIPLGLNYEDFLKQLKENFFSHKFIKSLLRYNGEGRRFGDLRAWIQEKTTSVPTPRRFEINDPLNHIYNLVVELSDGQYQKIQPGKHTWVLKKIK